MTDHLDVFLKKHEPLLTTQERACLYAYLVGALKVHVGEKLYNEVVDRTIAAEGYEVPK